MYIRVNENGNILMVSKFDNVGCVKYTGVLPKDFFTTFTYGKYVYSSGEILEIDGWRMPTIITNEI